MSVRKLWLAARSGFHRRAPRKRIDGCAAGADHVFGRGGCGAGHWALALALALVLMLRSALLGEEPADRFLDALRESGYHDAALLYLERMDGNPLAPAEFQAEIDYQRGVTLVAAAAATRDRAVREQMLHDAKARLEKFLKEQPQSPKRLFARRQFSLLLRQWAAMKVESAKRGNDDPRLLKEAAGLFQEAFDVSVAATEELRTELASLKKEFDPNTEQEQIDYRDELRAEFLLALIRAAESLEEKAGTEPADSEARKELLQQARDRYEEIFKKYGQYLTGWQARLYQARCAVALGERAEALKWLTEDLMAQSDERPAMRRLKTEAMLLAMECWMQGTPPDYATPVAQAEPWLETMRPAESEEDVWVLLRLRLAEAQRRLADTLAQENSRDERIPSAREAARKLARAVARIPGPYQEQGRTLLAEIPGGVAAARVETREPPKSFEEARSRGTDAVSEMQSAEYLLANVPTRLESESDAQVKRELEQKLQQAEETIAAKRSEAAENLRLALTMADSETPVEDLNLVRRLLAYLAYTEADYYDAVVMGEFIARRFPGAAGAREGARIALAAYLKLHETDDSALQDFATDHIVALASYIVETWGGTAEAAEAINTLIPLLISQGQLDQARAYVESIPSQSPDRAEAELRIGEALWRDYLIGMGEVRAWEKEARENPAEAPQIREKVAAREPELQETRGTALRILEDGVTRARQAPQINAAASRAVLSLAQIYVESDDALKAVQLLDDPQIGPLALLTKDDPANEAPLWKEQAYRVALSAFVSALPKVETTEQRSALIERSRDMIRSLRELVGDSPESQKRLTQIFFSLARGLETQLQLLDDPADRRVLSTGFRTFLEQVRGEAEDLGVLNWVAESFASLGKGLGDDQQAADAARTLFMDAVATYDQILAEAARFGLTPELARQLKFRKAIALRDARRFDEATTLMQAVLGEDTKTLEYQVETARTFQMWAAQPRQGAHYLTAVRGTQADAQSQQQLVWGWDRIADVTQRDKRYREDFYEARFYAADCNYRLALLLRDPDKRKSYFERAKNGIVFTQRLFPDLGGQKWFAKYSDLLKKIQKALDEPVVGLARG